MPTTNFDIYATEDAYMAVTNDVRRRILSALEEQPLQLPELVELTGKSKSTLSSIHMTELVDKGLVDEQRHPDDSRKKIYRVVGRKIGSSNIPLEQLREAVKEYVSVAPKAARFPLSVTLDALAHAPESTSTEVLKAQARRLGLLVGKLLQTADGRDLLIEVAELLEQEGLAEPVRLDMEGSDTLVLKRGDSAPRDVQLARVAVLVGSLIEGVLADTGSGERRVHVEVHDDTNEFSLSVDR